MHEDLDAQARRAGRHLESGRRAASAGLLEVASREFSSAVEAARGLVAALPRDATLRTGLGAALYDLGGAHQAAGRLDESVETLTEAWHVYGDLPASPGRERLRADVRLRRGITLAHSGAGASAVVDVQAAICAWMNLPDGSADELHIGAARVLMLGADVLGSYSDPAVALGAAQTGLSLYVTALRSGTTTPDPAMRHAMVQALSVEQQLLIELGRPEEALNATQTLDWLGVQPVPTLFGRRLQGDSPGLALALEAALDAVSRPAPALVRLTQPRTWPLCAPVHRVSPDLVIDTGVELALAALTVLPDDPDAGMRLGLEAHYMVTFVWETAADAGHDIPDDLGALWCRLLGDLAMHAAQDDDDALARDLARWGTRAFLLLPPDAPAEYFADLVPAIRLFDVLTGGSESAAGRGHG